MEKQKNIHQKIKLDQKPNGKQQQLDQQMKQAKQEFKKNQEKAQQLTTDEELHIVSEASELQKNQKVKQPIKLEDYQVFKEDMIYAQQDTVKKVKLNEDSVSVQTNEKPFKKFVQQLQRGNLLPANVPAESYQVKILEDQTSEFNLEDFFILNKVYADIYDQYHNEPADMFTMQTVYEFYKVTQAKYPVQFKKMSEINWRTEKSIAEQQQSEIVNQDIEFESQSFDLGQDLNQYFQEDNCKLQHPPQDRLFIPVPHLSPVAKTSNQQELVKSSFTIQFFLGTKGQNQLYESKIFSQSFRLCLLLNLSGTFPPNFILSADLDWDQKTDKPYCAKFNQYLKEQATIKFSLIRNLQRIFELEGLNQLADRLSAGRQTRTAVLLDLKKQF